MTAVEQSDHEEHLQEKRKQQGKRTSHGDGLIRSRRQSGKKVRRRHERTVQPSFFRPSTGRAKRKQRGTRSM